MRSRVACDYADDASVILAGTVVIGREQIAGLFAYFLDGTIRFPGMA